MEGVQGEEHNIWDTEARLKVGRVWEGQRQGGGGVDGADSNGG